MKEEIWNVLFLYLIRIEIGVFKNFKECARSPCNGNHFSSICRYVCMYVCRGPKSVGGITWAKRAHAQCQYWAVKSYQ